MLTTSIIPVLPLLPIRFTEHPKSKSELGREERIRFRRRIREIQSIIERNQSLQAIPREALAVSLGVSEWR